MQKDKTKAFKDDFPADLCAGKNLIFIYANNIEYQYVGDAKYTFYESLIQNNGWKTVAFAGFN